jgi:hypothetical protein
MNEPIDAEFYEGPDETAAAIVHVDNGALATLTKSEIESQLDAAHRYPRSTALFLKEAESMVTLSKAVAQSCMYLLPRGRSKSDGIPGPSVRLAEICASAYGNLQVATRILEPTETEAVAQAVAWDAEKNVRMTVEVRRRIIDRYGKRYNGDMVNVTGAAAAAIAKRNAIFAVVPRAFVDVLYAKAKACAVGDAKTLPERRDEVIAWLGKQKKAVSADRVLAVIEKTRVEDIDLEDLERLMALIETCKRGELKVEEAFPIPGAAGASGGIGTGQTLEERLAAKGAKTAPQATATGQPTTAPAGATTPAPAPAREPGED